MKKLLTNLFLLSLVCSVVALGQVTKYNYQFKKVFPDSSYLTKGGVHALTVDHQGRVWIGRYSNADSIQTAAGTMQNCRSIDVFNPDGTPASISRIRTLTLAGVTDTLTSSTVGMSTANDGNILASVRLNDLYKINAKTGAAMAKRHFVLPAGHSLTRAACDTLGELVIRSVFAGEIPLMLLDNNFADLGNAQDVTGGFSRTVAISPDGNDVFNCEYSAKYVLKVHSDNGTIGPYNKVDTLMKGLAVESIAFHPKTGYLWVSAGSNNDPCTAPGQTAFSWYAYMPPTYSTPVDSFKWQGSTTNDPRPRGIAFSLTGDTVYVAQFQDGTSKSVQMFTKGVTSVHSLSNAVVKDFTLGQNYPNPFNPSTKISFTLPKAGSITLKVYDVLGKEVATLAEGRYEAGAFTVPFDAKNMNSGVYFYTLRSSNGFVQTNKMLLMK